MTAHGQQRFKQSQLQAQHRPLSAVDFDAAAMSSSAAAAADPSHWQQAGWLLPPQKQLLSVPPSSLSQLQLPHAPYPAPFSASQADTQRLSESSSGYGSGSDSSDGSMFGGWTKSDALVTSPASSLGGLAGSSPSSPRHAMHPAFREHERLRTRKNWQWIDAQGQEWEQDETVRTVAETTRSLAKRAKVKAAFFDSGPDDNFLVQQVSSGC